MLYVLYHDTADRRVPIFCALQQRVRCPLTRNRPRSENSQTSSKAKTDVASITLGWAIVRSLSHLLSRDPERRRISRIPFHQTPGLGIWSTRLSGSLLPSEHLGRPEYSPRGLSHGRRGRRLNRMAQSYRVTHFRFRSFSSEGFPRPETARFELQHRVNCELARAPMLL